MKIIFKSKYLFPIIKINANCPESEKIGKGPGSCGGNQNKNDLLEDYARDYAERHGLSIDSPKIRQLNQQLLYNKVIDNYDKIGNKSKDSVEYKKYKESVDLYNLHNKKYNYLYSEQQEIPKELQTILNEIQSLKTRMHEIEIEFGAPLHQGPTVDKEIKVAQTRAIAESNEYKQLAKNVNNLNNTFVTLSRELKDSTKKPNLQDSSDLLTEDEKSIIRKYTSGSTEMNLLLADKTTKLPEEKEREILKNANKMSEVLSKFTLPKSVKVHRGVGSEGWLVLKDLDALNEGTEFKYPSFMSTSLNKSTAKQFSDYDNNGKRYMVELDLPEGTNAIYIDKISNYSGEGEIIVNKDVSFESLGISETSGEKVLHLKAIPNN